MSRRLAGALTALACAAALAGCGGGEAEPERRADAPKIPRDVADDLAARSDAVADRFEAGDVCGAAVEADALVDETRAAIEAGDVPQRYEDELLATALELQNSINCEQAPPPPQPQPEEEEEEKEKDKDEDKGKGKGNGNGEGEGDGTLTVEDVLTVEEG